METGSVRASLFSLFAALTPLLHSRSVPSQPETLTNGKFVAKCLCVAIVLLSEPSVLSPGQLGAAKPVGARRRGGRREQQRRSMCGVLMLC
jgi:hypothetical protein